MLDKYVIRKVSHSDVDALLSISKNTFFESFEALNNPDDFKVYTEVAFTADKLSCELAHPHSKFFFAMDGDEIIGYIKLNVNDAQTEFQDKNALEVERIYVLSTHQGKRIGELLLNFAIAIAQINKFDYVWLGVWQNNVNAIRFYQRHGYVKFQEHYFMIGNDKQTDILMRKAL